MSNAAKEMRTVQNQAQGFTVTNDGRSILDLLNNPKTQEAFKSLAGKIMTPERMFNLCTQAIRKTPKLKQCEPLSVLGAMMASAALGLEPNTVLQQAFLIPYDKKGKVNGKWEVVSTECQFQIGYRGFIALGYRSPHIRRIEANAIHEGDLFEHMQGSQAFLKYAKSLRGRGDLIGSYCLVELAEGAEAAYVMPLDEIQKIRSKSETYSALLRNLQSAEKPYEKANAQKKLDETPWVMWEDDMSAKSAIKKLFKTLPIQGGDPIASASELDNDMVGKSIDMKAMADPELARAVANGEEAIPMIEHQEEDEIVQDLKQMQQKAPHQETQLQQQDEPQQTRQRRAQANHEME